VVAVVLLGGGGVYLRRRARVAQANRQPNPNEMAGAFDAVTPRHTRTLETEQTLDDHDEIDLTYEIADSPTDHMRRIETVLEDTPPESLTVLGESYTEI
jgi:hypothetical protein